MKYLFILILGFALGIYVDRFQLPADVPAKDGPTGPPASRSAFDDKIRQWRLTPEDIRQDLDKSGEVARTQAHKVGERISDAKIVTVVKAKYILDRDLSSAVVHVSATDGHVTLAGTVNSPVLIGRAVAFALDTDGVTNVSSKLTVAPN